MSWAGGFIGSVSHRTWTVAFIVYAVALFVLTHWPRLSVTVPGVDRPDLFVHASVFGLWTLLLWRSGLVGSFDNRQTVLWAGVIGLGYAALDEGLQAVPMIGRHAAWDDLAANATGVLAATAFGLLYAHVRSKPRVVGDADA